MINEKPQGAREPLQRPAELEQPQQSYSGRPLLGFREKLRSLTGRFC
jgi:hypothetical protein